ncbi:MAG: hypothetical protein HWD82_08320 [Flavobacteriaceae bacterium]|nr:hypothetical protein [Flavobacteriaceae bacterium]
MKLILFFLLSFQSIEKPIDSYFDSSDEIFYLLYDEKIEKYSLESEYKLLSSIEIKYSINLNLKNFKFVDQHLLSNNLGGEILEIRGDSIFRIDNSYNHKLQLGSLEFIRNDTIFRYGGYGFFENRNFFTYYNRKINSWEFLNIKGDIIPEELSNFLYYKTKDNIYILGGFTIDKFNNDIIHKNYNSYKFDFKTKKWKHLGKLNNHIERNLIIPLDNDTFFSFNKQNGNILKFNINSNLIEEFYKTPTTKKIQSSFLKPFVHNDNLHFFNYENNQLNFNSISIKDFESSLRKTDSRNIYKNSYLFLIGICLSFIVIVFSIIVITKKTINKIIKINGLYFYNFKRLSLRGKEEVVFNIIFNQSRNNVKVDNRTITEIFYDENLNYTTINRRKNESINKLNDKFKILLKTNKDIILREQSEIDKREIFYSINSKFL